MSARFTPDAVRAWSAAARRAVDDTLRAVGKVDVPQLTNGSANIALSVVRDSTGMRFDLETAACRSGMGAGPWRDDVILLADALDSAARTASALRPAPSDRGLGPFSVSDVTCAVRIDRAPMPAWPAALGKRPASRAEVLARFIVTEKGRVDLTTLVWDRAPVPAAARAARDAMATWRYEPATSGFSTVRQWTHAIVWFADSSDADERQLAGWVRRTSFVARNDGRIAHAPPNVGYDSVRRPGEVPHHREAYPPSAVRAWLAAVEGAGGRIATLAVPGGITRSDGETSSAYYSGCGRDGSLSTNGLPRVGRTLVIDSVRAALAAAERVPLRAVDSTRVHGESEVTCIAQPRVPLSPVLATWSGARELTASFVVSREGHVDAASVVVLGGPSRHELRTLRAALAAQTWEPGRLSGVHVPQRAHLVLYPVSHSAADVVTEACAKASAAAVRLRVREPARGIVATELTGLAHEMSQRLGLQGRPSATDGAFILVLDDEGDPHFFSWIRSSSDPIGADVVRRAFREPWPGILGSQMVAFVPGAPLALEAQLARACR